MSEKTTNEPPVETKRPYQSPTLVEYGDIRQVTQASAQGALMDSHGGAPDMTG